MKPRQSLVLAVCAATIFAAPGRSQAPTEVHDINRVATETSSRPSPALAFAPDAHAYSFVRAGGFLFFAATTPEAGRELWRSDGTAAGTVLVEDLYPGVLSSEPAQITAVGARVFFTAFTPAFEGSLQLCVSDGTAAGTQVLTNVGGTPSEPRYLVALGGRCFFRGAWGGFGAELWVSDGTPAGTHLLADIWPGAQGSDLRYLWANAAGDRFFFRADDGVHGDELWVSDGTAAGTTMLADLRPAGDSDPHGFVNVGAETYFVASDTVPNLWRTDGTAAGTVLVTASSPGPGFAADTYHRAVLGNLLFFAGSTAATGTEVWVSDGTDAGTGMVADLRTGFGASGGFEDAIAFGGAVYFAADDGVHGEELWRTDGTAAGTVLVSDIVPGGTRSNPEHPVIFGGSMYWAAGGVSDRELWRSDGTAAGTWRLENINPAGSGSPCCLTGFGGRFVFVANDGIAGVELWESDGTVAGTRLFADLYPWRGETESAEPNHACRRGAELFFAADDGINGTELWKTDGTDAGTHLVTVLGAGTRSGSSPWYLSRLGDRIVFAAETTTTGRELFISDGTAPGTGLLKDIVPGPADGSPASLSREIAGRIYFDALGELFVTDGSTAGTYQVLDLSPGPARSSPSDFAELPDSGGRFVFRARSSGGFEDWEPHISDGTTAGTRLLVDLVPGTDGSNAGGFTPFRGGVIFSASEGIQDDDEPWWTDGTAAGTRRLADVWPGRWGSEPRFFAVTCDTCFFAASDGVHGRELWKTDGTAAGTVLVADLRPGSAGSDPEYITVSGSGEVVFAADDGAGFGTELWRSDGTAAGTWMVADLRPGALGSNPFMNGPSDPQAQSNRASFAVLGKRILFRADGGVKGAELWSYEPGAMARELGHSCAFGADPQRRPTLCATDPVMGSAQRIRGDGALAGSTGVLLLGWPAAQPIRIGTCAFHLDLLAPIVILDTWINDGGAWSFPQSGAVRAGWPVPNDPRLVGVEVALQAMHLGTDSYLGFDLTNAVLSVLGLPRTVPPR